MIRSDSQWVKWYKINSRNSQKYPKTNISYLSNDGESESVERENELANRRTCQPTRRNRYSAGWMAGTQAKNHEKQIYSRDRNGANLMQRERNTNTQTHTSESTKIRKLWMQRRKERCRNNWIFIIRYIFFPWCFSHLLFLLGVNCTNSAERRQ